MLENLYLLTIVIALLLIINIIIIIILFQKINNKIQLPNISNELSIQRQELQSFSKSLREEIIQQFYQLQETNRNLQVQTQLFLEKHLKEQKIEQAIISKNMEDQLSTHFQQSNKWNMDRNSEMLQQQDWIKRDIQEQLKEIRLTTQNNLQKLQEQNYQQIEKMRLTVDEKLHETVEKRFNQSFKIISERLEQVHKGLGEMQHLATGVGDLKKVLTNVKTRGNWGEIQLGAILEQILSPEQYIANTAVLPNGTERVEYAIKLPSKTANQTEILLPIDSKFPLEDYLRWSDLLDQATNVQESNNIRKNLENTIKKAANEIKMKYIHPPYTTDFAIMFIPTEGLYATILNLPGLMNTLQNEYRVTIVGPTNLVAFLNSLQMGFRTLAIEKRSSEVWQLLGIVKKEFGSFGDLLDKTHKKLQEATNVIESASSKTRNIQRKLNKVEDVSTADDIQHLL